MRLISERMGWARDASADMLGTQGSTSLEPHQVRSRFLVAMFGGPQIERHRGHFIHQRHSPPVDRQINRFQIEMAGVACLHSHPIVVISGVSRQLLMVFLAADGTQYPAELPLR